MTSRGGACRWAMAAGAIGMLAGAGCVGGPEPVLRVVLADFEEREIYHSPQTPGWTAWVSLWKLRGGDLMASFLQATGDLQAKPDYNFARLKRETLVLRSADGGKSWRQVAGMPLSNQPQPDGWYFNGGGFVTVQQLSDGSLLGARWGRDWVPHRPEDGLLFSSTDEGKTWSEPRAFNDPGRIIPYASRLRQLRDGTLILAYEGRKAGLPAHARWQHAGIYVSRDLGRTWEGPDIIAPADDGLVAYPEPAFVELLDGSLLFVFRIENYPDLKDDGKYHSGRRRMCRATREGGRWVAGPIQEVPIPHAGHPELLLTREGIVLYFCENGYWSSADQGRTWSKVQLPAHRRALYYPQAVQLDDGRILVLGHVGADNPFPPPQDMSISAHGFRVRQEPLIK